MLICWGCRKASTTAWSTAAAHVEGSTTLGSDAEGNLSVGPFWIGEVACTGESSVLDGIA